ncbi:MAG: peptidase U32, partial [Deltaproteobacteria bacterium]|nr:peptidase U32 [Deltaproteobacteria bacterium]
MKLSVAYNFDKPLLSGLSQIPEVYEIYGKMTKDIIGGGRSSYTLRHITKDTIRRTVQEAHLKNIEFNYLLNGAFLNGMEQTRSGQKKIRSFLNFLDKSEVDSITVASPYLLRLIKKQYPGFKVRISVFSLVNTVEKAKRWRDMGADTICISGISLNRNFKMLSNIRKAVGCDLQLIPNASCLPDCVYELAHMNMLALSSRIKDKT